MFLLGTASTTLNCCKARLATNEFNLVCLHIINRTIEVTNSEKIAVTNRRNVYSVIIKKGIFLSQL